MNDREIAGGRIEQTLPMLVSIDDAAAVGMDEGTPVIEDYQARGTKFAGKIFRVTVDVKEMGAGGKAGASKAGAEAARKIEVAKGSNRDCVCLFNDRNGSAIITEPFCFNASIGRAETCHQFLSGPGVVTMMSTVRIPTGEPVNEECMS